MWSYGVFGKGARCAVPARPVFIIANAAKVFYHAI
ncbi:hypothetical protein X759_36285 [Mesorhizobium sp. LSHC420B00]|nr:hypothetical protein X772_35175 [Mesorhizobium sp. LSJC280B00]ESX59567.1 hypothetical protein X759_36285 [Mesorhizobium sp. LSHC420B00]